MPGDAGRTTVTDTRAGVAGILFVASVLTHTVMIGIVPDLGSGAAPVAAYLADQRSTIDPSVFLSFLFVPALTWYLVRLVMRCQRSGQPTLATAVVVLTAAGGTLSMAAFGMFHAASLIAPSSAETAFGLVVASSFLSAQSMFCFGLLMLVVSVVVLRSAAFVKWYGLFGLVTSAVAVGSAAVALTSLSRLRMFTFGGVGLLAWIFAGSVLFIQGRRIEE
jgi:hypothetical protein